MDDAQTSASTVRPPLLDQSPARAKRERWLHVVMAIVVTALLLMVVAIPSVVRRSSSPADSDVARARAALDEIRRAIGQYRYDHGAWPGSECGELEDGSACFVRQLTRASSAGGDVSAGAADPRFGPYLPRDLPTNPINGLTSVRMLLETESWPVPVDGKSGWIYRPSTGELRINAPGEADGVRFIDL